MGKPWRDGRSGCCQMKLLRSLAIHCLVLAALTMTTRARSLLHVARKLDAPLPQSTEQGETEGSDFWEQHATLLRSAWQEWEDSRTELPALDASNLLNESLRNAVDAAWKDPATEDSVRELWSLVAPNVYRCQLFNAEKISKIREHIDGASNNSGIPTRRPNGMNRYGLILHPQTIDGAVYLNEFGRFYKQLIEVYIRPMGRLLFPEFVGPGNDHASYAFTIRYKDGEDISLNEHTDSSLITLNVNLNTPGDKGYVGSTIYFVDEATRHNVTFQPGMALLHLGQTRHAALPLERGERTNMVIWMYGEHGYVRIAPYEVPERLSQKQRWTKPPENSQTLGFDEL